MRNLSTITLVFAASVLLFAAPGMVSAQTDCLACHADQVCRMRRGTALPWTRRSFIRRIHGSLKCGDCHTTIKEYPHPDKVTPVKCETCHADEAAGLVGSVHANRAEHPCTSCHGDAHSIFPKDDPRSAVYPLNVPRTCGTCHGNDAMAKKHGLPNVYPMYIDSIHGFALSKEGLLVAANCQSCHGSHHILSHKDPESRTYKTNIPKTCGTCHAGITENYENGVHGKAVAKGNLAAPVCSDCHTAHAILQPTEAAFRIAVHAHMRIVPQGQVFHLPGYVPLATGIAGRICGDGALLGLPRSARCAARIRSPLAGQQGEPGEDLRQVPCGRQCQLRAVSATCQRATIAS